MATIIKITLGEVEFDVPRLNIGQIEEIAAITASGKSRPFDALRIAMTRATPACEDLSSVEASPLEISAAMEAILKASGVVLAKPGGSQKARSGLDEGFFESTECGYTPDQIRDMTLADVIRLFAYWHRRPPAGELINIIAQIAGWKPQAPEIDEEVSFTEAANENAEWFENPARFFARDRQGTPVKLPE